MKFHHHDWRRRVLRGELLTQTVQRVDRVKSFVESEAPLAHIALRFCLSHPDVTTVIPGVRTVEQVRCNLAASDQGTLPQQVRDNMTRLWSEEFQQNVRTSIGEVEEG